MNQIEATTIILSEAFAENGLVTLAHRGEDPGFQRMETLIAAINFLADDMSSHDSFDRMLFSALFVLGTTVPEEFSLLISPTSDSRCSLYRQTIDLNLAVFEMIENWSNWPTEDDLLFENLPDSSAENASKDDEEFEGHRVGDITYCTLGRDCDIFPVKIVRLGFNVIEVEAISSELCRDACETFSEDRLNRCFQLPKLPNISRFGGFDHRPVNAARRTGPELRLLPSRYVTMAGEVICQRHKIDPVAWPLPTGIAYQLWFKEGK